MGATGPQNGVEDSGGVFVGVLTPSSGTRNVNLIFIDDGTPLTLDTRNGPAADAIFLDSGVNTYGGPLFGYEYPWSDNARWGWSGSLIGDGTDYAAGTVVKAGVGVVAGGIESVIPVPIPVNNPYFGDSQRFAVGRLTGNVLGMVFGAAVTADGLSKLSGATILEVSSAGTLSVVAVPVGAVGVVEVAGGLYVIVSAGSNFTHNVRNFPGGGGGGGGGVGGNPLPQRQLLTADEFSKLPQSGVIDPKQVRFSQDSIASHF